MLYSLTTLTPIVHGNTIPLQLVERLDDSFRTVNYGLAYWPETEGESSPMFVHDENGFLFATLLPVAAATLTVLVVYWDGTTTLYSDVTYTKDGAGKIDGATMVDSNGERLTLWHNSL